MEPLIIFCLTEIGISYYLTHPKRDLTHTIFNFLFNSQEFSFLFYGCISWGDLFEHRSKESGLITHLGAFFISPFCEPLCCILSISLNSSSIGHLAARFDCP